MRMRRSCMTNYMYRDALLVSRLRAWNFVRAALRLIRQVLTAETYAFPIETLRAGRRRLPPVPQNY